MGAAVRFMKPVLAVLGAAVVLVAAGTVGAFVALLFLQWVGGPR